MTVSRNKDIFLHNVSMIFIYGTPKSFKIRMLQSNIAQSCNKNGYAAASARTRFVSIAPFSAPCPVLLRTRRGISCGYPSEKRPLRS